MFYSLSSVGGSEMMYTSMKIYFLKALPHRFFIIIVKKNLIFPQTIAQYSWFTLLFLYKSNLNSFAVSFRQKGRSLQKG